MNDLHDLAIDRVSNRRRPLVEGVIGKDEARGLATVLLACPRSKDRRGHDSRCSGHAGLCGLPCSFRSKLFIIEESC